MELEQNCNSILQVMAIHVVTDKQTDACATNRHVHVLNTCNNFLLLRAEKLRTTGPGLYVQTEEAKAYSRL